ncbi:MAG TPA: peptidoglycan-associated lipoprotein Pal [Ramlibacter sp.]|jgi:peptidoglycan-associated lipoprotein
MIKRMFLAVAVALAVAGCSSVPLDDVPVEDKSAGAVTGQPGGPGSGTQSSVAPVAADPAIGTVVGPANVARIIYFDYDSYVIKPQFQSLLDGHARFLRANNGRRISIEGHTDERGGREYNLALGQRRSEAVRQALGLLGVPDRQVEAVSFGKEKPVAMGSDEAAWSQNRRAEIVYR